MSTQRNPASLFSWITVLLSIVLVLYALVGPDWNWKLPSNFGGDGIDGKAGSFSEQDLSQLGFVVGDGDLEQKWDYQTARDMWEAEEPISLHPTPAEGQPSSPFSAVILYLLTVSRSLTAASSLESVARNFPFTQPYPILFLHEGGFDSPLVQEAWLDRWYARATEVGNAGEPEVEAKMRVIGKLVEFIPVDLVPPAEVLVLGKEKINPLQGYAWPGYHSMCRFFATYVFQHPRIRIVDYYMRLDSDSFIYSPIEEDPFVTMHRQGAAYGYRNVGSEPDNMCQGMWDFVEDYQERHPDTKGQSKKNGFLAKKWAPRFPTYNNNMELIHVPTFQREDIHKFLIELRSRTMDFYAYRWGDAPLRYATVQMFLEPEQILEFCHIGYFHQIDITKTCNLTSSGL